jgi:O-glycosyl hydrolase
VKRHVERLVESLEPRTLLAADPLTATVDAGRPRQTIDALGGAIQAPAQTADQRQVAYYDRLAEELGVSIVRAALWQTFEPVNDNNDPNVIDWSKFDDRALANAMAIFQQLKARGVNQFLLTMWTPPGWMKTNKSANHGGHVRSDQRQEFAEYVSAALQRAKSKWGIDVTHLSISNEPWLIEPYGSATMTPIQYRELLKVVDARLQRDGLGNVKLVGPEEVSRLQRSYRYLEAIQSDPQALNALDVWGTHYLTPQDMGTLNNRLTALGKPLWVTEMGAGSTDLAGAQSVARGIDSVFTTGGATGYVNWLISGTPSTSTFETLMNGPRPNKKFYALAHFARFVRPGAKLLTTTYSGDQVRVTSFRHPTSGAVTIVINNTRPTDVDLTVNLRGLGTSIPAAFQQYRTSATEDAARLADVAGASSMLVNLPANSIVTLYAGPALSAKSTIPAPPGISTPFPTDAWNTNKLREAAMRGQLANVQSLIAAGADVNASFGNGWNALFTAAASPYVDADKVIAELLKTTIDRQKKDVEGMTALHVAAMNPNVRWAVPYAMPVNRINLLVAAGLNPNQPDGWGRTPLHYAAMFPKVASDMQQVDYDASMVRALLAAGADPNAVDSAGKRPIDYARAEGFTPAISTLAAASGANLASFGGKFFVDADSNGVLDPADKGAGGRTVWIDLDNDAVVDANEPRQVAGVWGDYSFIDVAPGTYTVRQVVPAGWTATVPFRTITLAANQDVTGVDFGSIPVANVGVVVTAYRDLNKDATRGVDEPGVSGATFWIDLNDDAVRDATEPSATTGATGEASFVGLLPGTYRVRMAVLSGLQITQQPTTLITVNGAQPADVRFGLWPVPGASVSGSVVNDLNKSGTWNTGENGIAGRTVWLDLDNDRTLDPNEPTALTDARGRYVFTGLAAGAYVVRQLVPAGWIQTRPNPQYGLNVSLTTGQARSNFNFYVATI